MHRSRIPRRFAVKLLLGATLLIAVLMVAVGCSSETAEVAATAEPVASPTPQPEATAEAEGTSTEVLSPTATPVPPPTSEPTVAPRPTPTPRPTATPIPTSLRQMWIQESVSPVNCDDQWLVDGIVQLSEENKDSSATRILKLYSDMVEEIERTDKILRCRTEAAVSSGQDRNVTYSIEIDRDGDVFHGYEIGSEPLRPTPTSPSSQTLGIGDNVRLGNFELTLHRVRGSLGDGDAVPETGNYFLLIDAFIRNVGGRAETVRTLVSGEIRDAENNSYRHRSVSQFDPYYHLDGSTGWSSRTNELWVSPGQSINSIAHYEGNYIQ